MEQNEIDLPRVLCHVATSGIFGSKLLDLTFPMLHLDSLLV